MTESLGKSSPDHTPNLSLRVAPGEPTDCPFPSELLTHPFGLSGIPLTSDDTARCVAARQRRLTGIVERLTVDCAAAPTQLPAGSRLAYAVPARYHVDLWLGDRRVHIEAIRQQLAGPGGSNKEVRVYVNGALEGRSILLGRLGATVDTFPLVAAVGPGVVMTVTPARWTDLRELIVEIRHQRRDEP